MVYVTYFASYWPVGVSLLVAEEYLLRRQLRRGEYPLVQIDNKCIWEKMIPVWICNDATEEGANTMEAALYWPD